MNKLQRNLLTFLAVSVFSAGLAHASEFDYTVYAHVQDLGQTTYGEDQWVGQRGSFVDSGWGRFWLGGKRLEEFSVNPMFPPQGNWESGCNLSYMAHIQSQGDTSWVLMGNRIGTEGRARRIEGLAFKLDGACRAALKVQWRCHLAGVGTTRWHEEGEFCGTRGESRALEAFQMRIVPR